MRRSIFSLAAICVVSLLGCSAAAQTIISDGDSAVTPQMVSAIGQQTGPITLARPARPTRAPIDKGRLNLQPATVGKGLEILAIGSVDLAPKTALPITISSSDPTKLLLSPLSTDPTGVNEGVASFVGTLPANKGINGNGFPAFWIQALASSGTAQITLGAPGYTTASATITLTPAGFVLVSPLGMGANFTTQLNSADTNLTISTAQLDAGGNVLQTDQKLRGGSNVSVDINDGTPATGTVSGVPVSLLGGDSSTTLGALKFHPVNVGTTLLSIAQPTGFTAPVAGGQLTATVHTPSISLTPSVVGYNLQVLGSGSINTPAPAGGLLISISSSDANKVLLTTNPTLAGSATIGITVPASSTLLPTFYIQGLASSGTVALTASATGYISGVANVLLNQTGFVVNSPNGGGNFATTTLSSATDLEVSAWQLNSSLMPIVAGQIRGGASIPVEVVSGNTTAGTISGGAVTFHGGDYSQTGISFSPNPNCATPCTSVLSITHTADYATPSQGGQITATVNKPTVTLRVTQSTIGQNLQILGSGALDVPAPSDLSVTITSNNPNVLLSSSPTDAGTQTLNLIVPTGSGVNSIGFPNYYIQALSNSGTAQLSISATGFGSSNINISLSPAGFVIEGPNGIGNNFGVVNNATEPLTLRAVVLDKVTLSPTVLYQAVRGGITATVDVTSSATGVATLVGTPAMITSGNATGTITFQPQAPGQTTITVITPAGYATPASGKSMIATVN